MPTQSSLTDYRLAWLRRGQELNAIYDELTAAVGKSPNGDPVEDLKSLAEERDRLRALLKQAHDRDKWQGEFPTIKWYDDVARYFRGQCP